MKDIQMMAELIHESDIARGIELGKRTVGVWRGAVENLYPLVVCVWLMLMDVISCLICLFLLDEFN